MMKDNSYCQGPYITDYGPEPFVVDIAGVTRENRCFRMALWTGNYLQLTLMCIKDEIGLEMHPETDQFLRIEEGYGFVMMGKSKDDLNYQTKVCKGDAIFVPAGTWHNVVNCGNTPLKLYSIYAPPRHPHGAIQRTREEAESAKPY